MKRPVAMILAGLLALTLAACSRTQPELLLKDQGNDLSGSGGAGMALADIDWDQLGEQMETEAGKGLEDYLLTQSGLDELPLSLEWELEPEGSYYVENTQDSRQRLAWRLYSATVVLDDSAGDFGSAQRLVVLVESELSSWSSGVEAGPLTAAVYPQLMGKPEDLLREHRGEGWVLFEKVA